MINNISIIKDCSSCGACVCTCPVKAITTEEDFYYKMTVDSDKCISCGKCLSVCPVYNQKKENKPLKAIGGWAKQANVRAKSSSGGAFSLLAEYVLSQNGVIFGACFSDDCKTVAFNSTDNVSLDDLRRSKYVESYTGDSFIQVKDNLKNGRLVLFCGTPCQVAGLSNYLNKDYDNLILCDFACGGLPSHKIYRNYIDNLEKKHKSKVVSVNFRPKVSGWSRHHILIKFANGTQYSKLAILDPYFYSFVYGRVSIRENCYDCKFSNNHFSDITLADYWKYTDTPEITNDEKGISLITANTANGVSVLEHIINKMQYYELDLQKAAYNFKETIHNEQNLSKHQQFFYILQSKGLTQGSKAYGMPYGIKSAELIIKRKVKVALSSWRKK